MSKKIFSLVIQDEYIKVLILKRSKVISYGLTKLTPGALINDKVVRDQLVADELGNLLKSARPKKIRTKYAVVDISDAQSFIKILKIPGIKKEEVEESLKWQLEKVLPLPPSKVYWDYHLIKSDKVGVEILLIASPRDSIDSIINTLDIAGITVKAIEPRSVALAKILTVDVKPILVVDLGFQKATIVIGKNGLPFFSTVESIDKDFSSIKKSIDRALDYYQKEYDKKIKNILVCGDQKVNELYSIIKKSFKDINVEKIQLDLKMPEQFKKLSLGFVSNIGLLTKENIFNLLPGYLKKQFEIEKINDTINRLVFYFSLFTLLIITFFGLSWLRLVIDLRHTEVSLLDTSKTTSTDLKDLEEQAKKINQQAKKINTLYTLPSHNVASLLKQINKEAPPNLTINNITIDYVKDDFKVTGLAQNREQMILFRDNLRKLSEISDDAYIPLEYLSKTENINFSIIGNLIK